MRPRGLLVTVRERGCIVANQPRNACRPPTSPHSSIPRTMENLDEVVENP